MARGRPRIPKYCLHKASGRAYVRLPAKPVAAVVYLGDYGTRESKARYREEIAKWLNRGDEANGDVRGVRDVAPPPPAASSSSKTVAEVGDAFVAHARIYYRKRGEPTSQVGMIEAAVEGMKAEAGGEPAEAFDAARLKSARDRAVASGLTRGGVNRRVSLIKQCLGWAVEEGLIPPAGWHSCLAVKGLKRERSLAPESEPVRPVPIEVVEASMPRMPRPVAAMVRLQLLTGMRPGEACQMTAGMIDRSAGGTWVFRPDRHKTEHHGHTREIPIGPRAQELISAWADWDRPDVPFFSPAAWMAEKSRVRREGRKTKVQPSQVDRRKADPKGTPPRDCYSEPTYRIAVARAAKAAGQPHWHPNQLRHTYGTIVRSRYGLEASQVLLGHASADVTQIYAERDLKKAAEIAAEIG